jgi:hypothetical protein
MSNVQFPTNQQNVVLVGNLNKNVFIIGSVSEIPNTTSDSGIYIIGNVIQQQQQQQSVVEEQKPVVASSVIEEQKPVVEEPLQQQQPVIVSSVVQQSNKRPSKRKEKSAEDKERINARRRELHKLRKEEALRIEYGDTSTSAATAAITNIEVTTSDTSTEAAAPTGAAAAPTGAAAETDVPYEPLPQSVIDQITENRNKIFETVTTATSVEEVIIKLSKTFDTGRSIISGRTLFFEAACDRLDKFDPMIDDYWKLVVEADPLLFREIYDR